MMAVVKKRECRTRLGVPPVAPFVWFPLLLSAIVVLANVLFKALLWVMTLFDR